VQINRFVKSGIDLLLSKTEVLNDYA